MMPADRPVLVFFADHDDTGPPTRVDAGRRRIERRAKRLLNRPDITGFEMWTRQLAASIREAGRTVRFNDYKLARRHPDYPVAVTGYPRILGWWDLPNPAILGPGMFDHPAVHPTLMDDPRFRHYIVTCDWMRAVFEPSYGSKLVDWFGGIDTDGWPDTASEPKDVDCLIYDKIRWNRESLVPSLLDPVVVEMERRGLRRAVIRYGEHSQQTYRSMLQRSRFMVFLCEHETQGFAYQEAMSSNLPILAWDPGFWQDPNASRYSAEPIHSSSVPYFGDECGRTFRDAAEFRDVVPGFLAGLGGFRPRDFVSRNLSLAASAARFLHHYDRLAESAVCL